MRISKKSELFSGNILKSGLLLACLLRACSLVWLEHPADNREVTGSNPVMPTKFSLLAGRQSHEGPSVRLLVTCLWLVALLEAMLQPL